MIQYNFLDNDFTTYEDVKEPRVMLNMPLSDSPLNIADWAESITPDGVPIVKDNLDSKMKFNNTQEQDKTYDTNISFEELIKQENLPVKITSGFRGKGDFRNGLTKQGRRSNHNRRDEQGNPMAYDIVPLDGNFDNLLHLMYSNPRIVNWLKSRGWGILEETTPEIMKRTGATGKHLHIGPDTIAKQMFNDRLLKGQQGLKFPYTVYETVEPEYRPQLQMPVNPYYDDYHPTSAPSQERESDSKMTFNNSEELSSYGSQSSSQPYSEGAKASGSVMDRAVAVARYLVNNGNFTKEQASAIAGVMIDENKVDPTSYMKAEKSGGGVKGTGGFGYGAGIGSWTFEDNKNQLLQAGGYKPYTPIERLSLEEQCRLLVIDSNGRNKRYYDALRRCTNIEDASATAVMITGGVGRTKNWNTHPTPADAKALSDWYGASNDARFGKSPYHWNLDKRRLDYAKQVLERL